MQEIERSLPFSEFWVKRLSGSFLRSSSVFIGFHTSTILSVLPPPSSVFSSISMTPINMTKFGKSGPEYARRGPSIRNRKSATTYCAAQPSVSHLFYSFESLERLVALSHLNLRLGSHK